MTEVTFRNSSERRVYTLLHPGTTSGVHEATTRWLAHQLNICLGPTDRLLRKMQARGLIDRHLEPYENGLRAFWYRTDHPPTTLKKLNRGIA